MTASRIYAIGSLALIIATTTLAVTYSQELSPAAQDEDVALFNKLNSLFETINENHYAKPDIKSLFSGAMNGMLHKLDPHSAFIDVSDVRRLEEQYRGNYAGIGVTFVSMDGKITVVDVAKGGPSDKAGLRMGDQIVEIDGEPALELESTEVQNKLRGTSGTKVEVGLERPYHDELVRTVITRGNIPIYSVQNEMLLDDVTGYVQVTGFARPTGAQLEKALLDLKKQGMKQLVLDLRGNPGGLLGTSIQLTDMFLNGKRLIVYTDGQTSNSRQSYYSSENGDSWDIPLVVLVNSGSASASEIVSGAFQDWDRAIIVGETSFGKGLVQRQFMLKDHSWLNLTTSHYYTPTGRLIQKPYKGLDVDTYQFLGYDLDGTEDLAKSPEFKEEKPVYFTPSGRTVHGGGGITPDVEVKGELLFDRFVLVMGNQLVPFMYAREYIWRERPNEMDFQAYFDEFQVTDEMLSELLEKARERKFVYYPRSGEKFSDKQLEEKFWELKEQLRLYLKAEIAQFYYGRPKGYTIRTLTNDRDKVLAKARDLFGLARQLVEHHKDIDPDFFAQRSDTGGKR